MNSFDFKCGAHIHFHDGRGGTLQKLVIDAHTHRVTDLVVEKGFLQKHDHVIPVSAVESVTPDEICLAIDSTQLSHFPEYREVDFMAPLEDWEPSRSPGERILLWAPYPTVYESTDRSLPMIRRHVVQGIENHQISIGRGTLVRNRDGDVGRIDHLLVDRESWKLTHIVISRTFLPYHRVVPISWIDDMTDETVHLRGTNTDLDELPHHQALTSRDILAEIQDRLNTARQDFSDVSVTLAHNTVQLRGVVTSDHARQEAEALVLSVPGVLDVENLLESHATVATHVTEALETDPRTAGSSIEVLFDRGIVTLEGDVPTLEAHTAAEEIAANYAGVISVVNALEVHKEESTVMTDPRVIANIVPRISVI